MMKRIMFGAWEPDSPDLGGMGRAGHVINMVPVKGGYRAINDWSQWGSNIASAGVGLSVIGALSTQTESGAIMDFIATTSVVYRLEETGTASVVTGSAGVAADMGYTTPWAMREFTQFGREIILVGGNDEGSGGEVCYFDVGSSSVFTGMGFSFRARTVTTMRDFVVYGCVGTSGDIGYNRVRWSAWGNSHDATPSVATQSDLQDLDTSFGIVRRLLGGNETFVICDNGAVIMSYVGGPVIMRFDYINKGFGTSHPQSCVRVGNSVYMFSRQGFIRMGMADGDITYIGNGRVDRTFLDLTVAASSGGVFVRGYHDPLNQCVGWQYTETGGEAIVYSYAMDMWVHHGANSSRKNARFIYPSAIAADAILGYGLVSRFQTAAALGLSEDELGYGLFLQARQDNAAKISIATGFEELEPGRKSIIDKVWPLCQGVDLVDDVPELQVSSVPKVIGINLPGEPSSTYSSTASLQTGGFFTIAGAGGREGKYHKFVLQNNDTAISRGGEQVYYGIDVEYFPRGRF